MYRVLEGKLKEREITRQKLSEDLRLSISTVSEKLSIRNRLKLAEAETIRNRYFPDMVLDVLFEWSDNKPA